MMAKKELIEKISKSEAFKTLKDEQKIHLELLSKKWHSNHGSFYKDQKTKKLREIDVIGRKRWRNRKEDSSEKLFLEIDLIIESKSISNYHLLFSGNKKNQPETFGFNEDWVGYDDHTKERIKKTLIDEEISLSEINEIIKILEEVSFPGGFSLVHNFRVEPFPVDKIFTAFSETNLGNIRELDNSVLWKAILTLESCIISLKRQSQEDILSSLKMDLKYSPKEESLYEKLSMFKEMPNSIRYFLPVVVIDSKLWSTIEKKPSEMKWCRLFIEKNDLFSNWWCDIVSRVHFQEYLSDLDEYFEGSISGEPVLMRL